MKKKAVSFTLLLILFQTFIVKNIIAAPIDSNGSSSSEGIGCGGGLGPIASFLCNIDPDPQRGGEMAGEKLNAVISAALGFMTIMATLWFAFKFITAGFAWISAGGDKSAVENARNQILNALIGLVVVVAAWIIMGLIGNIFGLDILNPGAALTKLVL